MAMTRIGTLALTCTILVVCARAQAASTIKVEQYGHRSWAQGSAGFAGSPRAIAQTTDGYIWLGTETGVLRFDGVRFIPAAALNLKLANPLVLRLLATTDGALWIATRSGLGRWKDGVLTAIPELADHVVTTVIEGHDGTIWAGTSGMPAGEPARLCSIHDMRANCDGANGAFGQLITTLFENTRGELWVGAMSGLWHWNTEHPVRYALRDPAPEIHSIVEMDDGSLLISISRDVVRLHHDIVETFSIGTVNGSIKPTCKVEVTTGGAPASTKGAPVFKAAVAEVTAPLSTVTRTH